MVITFVSVFLNHHQILLCEELRKNSDEFYFIATSEIPQARLDLGYEDLNCKYDYVIRTYDGSTTKKRIRELLSNSDIVIFGDCPNSYIEFRMRENKLSFLYSERFFKKGAWRRFIPSVRKKIEERVIRYKDKNLYILCASTFLSKDLKLLGFSEDKCYKWGYFPQVNNYDAVPEKSNDCLKLLWAGRLIDWKRTEDAINAAAVLKDKGIDFALDIIGNGDCETSLKKLTKKLGLEKQVNFLGSMSPESVAEYMEKADVYLMTSNFREGWGAVVNEAMSTGCAILVSSAVGSAKFLINDGENGLIYEYGNKKDLADKLCRIATDGSLRKKLGKAAFETIRDEYNQKVAVERLLQFVKNGCNKDVSHKTGPMTKAPAISNKWYKA